MFVFVYGTLVAPWPAWNAAYGAYFRGLCGHFLAHDDAGSIVRFRAAPAGAALDTQIVLVDPRTIDAHGNARGHLLGLDSRGVGWIPTAFLCALILSTWLPWPRRLGALGFGLLILHLYLLLAVRVYIWNRSLPELAVGPLAAALRWVGSGLEETMVTQLGPSFVVPAVIWILVSFRKEDLDAAREGLAAGRHPSPPGQGR